VIVVGGGASPVTGNKFRLPFPPAKSRKRQSDSMMNVNALRRSFKPIDRTTSEAAAATDPTVRANLALLSGYPKFEAVVAIGSAAFFD
jgi:hypothetical protein